MNKPGKKSRPQMHSLARCAAATMILAGCAQATTSGSSPGSFSRDDISEASLRSRLFAIADDSMMGRESGSEGDYKAAQYVAAEFRRLGLEPAGENGTWFQTVPFWRAAVDPTSSLTAGGATLTLTRDFLPASIASPGRTLNGVPTVYGGSVTDAAHWISAEQAAGKVVVLGLPAGTPLRGLALSSPNWSNAVTVAAATLDQMGTEQVARLLEGRPIPDTTRIATAVPLLWISRRAATTIFGAEPSTLSPGAAGQPLRGHFDILRTPVPFPARNVVAIFRGGDPSLRGEYVALTAHNDHVGYDHSPVDHDSLRAFNRVVRPMGADSPNRTATPGEWSRIRAALDSARRAHPARLDSIRNGADDDASGTVAILEIAGALSRRGVRPRRSILFVSHTGEEAGLLGSRWFTDHPTVPIDAIVADIDQDMVGRGTSSDLPRDGTGAGSATYMEVVGAKRLSREFGDSLEAANARQPVPFVFDYSYDVPGHPLQQYCRADHYSYARFGIPSVSFSRGEHLDYHQVTDEAQYISYADLARVTRMVYAGALAIANMSMRPAMSAPKPADPHGTCRQ